MTWEPVPRAPRFRGMAEDTSHNTDADRIWEILEAASVCMLVTRDGERLHARPMAPRANKAEHAIYFLTDARSAKDHEVMELPDVAITVMQGSDYVAVGGKAQSIRDAALAARLWSAFDKAFWDDANDPNIRVLKVTPGAGERWENPGKLVAFVDMAARTLTGERPPDETHKATL